jgi:hypothetical protein
MALHGDEVATSRNFHCTLLQIAFFSPSKPLNNNKKRAEIDWLLKF